MPDWPHAPLHRLGESGAYIVTAGTFGKFHLFDTADKLSYLHDQLLSLALKYQWQLQSWAIFSNHYHFIAQSQGEAKSLQSLIRHLHSDTARELNQGDHSSGRKVWFQYWETHLTYEKSYLARLKYVQENPVRHRMVGHSMDYPWCSARWFESMASPSFYKTVMSFKIDRVEVPDDFVSLMPITINEAKLDESGGKPPHSKEVLR